MKDYLNINKTSWNKRTDVHIGSDFYDNKSFIQGRSSLNEIELEFLGDLAGKSVLHLQCHFGQDTLSMARMGAETTGVDLSDVAIARAKELADKISVHSNFVCCDIYDLPNHLNEQFDIVFTSYGTICWLPDLDRWATVIDHFLKPGGQFVFVEFHPVVWMYDDDFTDILYKYFNSGPIAETEEGTYADKDAAVKLNYVMWNHGIGEVVTSLIARGLRVDALKEYDYSPYDFLNRTIAYQPGRYRVKDMDDKIPLVYAVVAVKL
jgi:SAM-dependent methyltransferase